MQSRSVLAWTTLVAIATLSRDARADFDFQASLGMNARWVRATPALEVPDVTTHARKLPSALIPVGGHLTLLGAYVDSAVVLDDHWVVPLFGGGFYGSIGSYDVIITSRDGSIVRAFPWTAFGIDMLTPGLGYRTKQRRWAFEAVVRTGVSWLYMDGVLADGADHVPMDEMMHASFLVQAELEACRRLDPTSRVCLQVAPRIYDHELLNGISFGLRAEWGR
jgi:hypothetical protein